MAGVRGLLQRRDLLGGLLLLSLGLWCAAQGLTYSVGTLRNMGPGFFPVSLGVALAGIGAALTVQGAATPPVPGRAAGNGGEWRGWLCLSAGIGLFILLGRYGGLLPATFAVVFVSALGDRRNSVRDAVLLALAASAVAVGVFSYALNVQFPLLAWG